MSRHDDYIAADMGDLSIDDERDYVEERDERMSVPAIDYLQDRIAKLNHYEARWLLYRMATGDETVRADMAEGLATLDGHPLRSASDTSV